MCTYVFDCMENVYIHHLPVEMGTNPSMWQQPAHSLTTQVQYCKKIFHCNLTQYILIYAVLMGNLLNIHELIN